MSAGAGSGFFSSKYTAARIIPGVQMPHCAPPHSRNASCRGFIKACADIPSMLTMLAPLACATGTRQLFTSIPSNKMEHEPHSPSPHPSFAPVNFKSFRSTSNNRSMGWTNNFFASPLTVNKTSHFAPVPGEVFMRSLAPKKENLAREVRAGAPQKDLLATAESNGIEHRSHLPPRLELRVQGHPWGVHRCLWRHVPRERCQAPQKIRGSAAGPRKSA